MPDLPVVEELLEKGARARAEFERGIPMEVYAGGNASGMRPTEPLPESTARAVLEQDFRTQRGTRLAFRLAVRSQWVPVEEGTDGSADPRPAKAEDFDPIDGGAIPCQGPPGRGRRVQRITNCDGGPDVLTGRRARWWYRNRPVCGTCKRRILGGGA